MRGGPAPTDSDRGVGAPRPRRQLPRTSQAISAAPGKFVENPRRVGGSEGVARPPEQLHIGRAPSRTFLRTVEQRRARRGSKPPRRTLLCNSRPASLRPAAFIPRKFRIVPAELVLKSRTYRIYPNRSCRHTTSDFTLAVTHCEPIWLP